MSLSKIVRVELNLLAVSRRFSQALRGTNDPFGVLFDDLDFALRCVFAQGANSAASNLCPLPFATMHHFKVDKITVGDFANIPDLINFVHLCARRVIGKEIVA